MIDPHPVLALAAVFLQLSLLAFGGANAVIPEMQRQVVDNHHWLSAHEFASLYALAQAAPGPNMMVVSLIGWRVAGLAGALVSTVSIALPSSIVTILISGVWFRFRDAGWRRAIQNGLQPVTIGLIMASAALLIRTTAISWPTIFLLVASALLCTYSRLHPILILAAAAVFGACGFA
jgi:chromate transporter